MTCRFENAMLACRERQLHEERDREPTRGSPATNSTLGTFPETCSRVLKAFSHFAEPRHIEISLLFASSYHGKIASSQRWCVCSTPVGRSLQNIYPHAAPILIALPCETSPLRERCRGSTHKLRRLKRKVRMPLRSMQSAHSPMCPK